MMVNPQRGEVAIRVDGREHVMRLTLGALAELEDRLKVTSLLGLAEKFETYWSTPDQTAKERMKLVRLAWDLVGSEFAGRHMQYEKFYAGPGFVMNAYSYHNCPWDELGEIVEGLLASYDVAPPG